MTSFNQQRSSLHAGFCTQATAMCRSYNFEESTCKNMYMCVAYSTIFIASYNVLLKCKIYVL